MAQVILTPRVQRARRELDRVTTGRLDYVLDMARTNPAALVASARRLEEADAWIVPLDEHLRLVFRIENDRVVVVTLLDRRDFKSQSGIGESRDDPGEGPEGPSV